MKTAAKYPLGINHFMGRRPQTSQNICQHQWVLLKFVDESALCLCYGCGLRASLTEEKYVNHQLAVQEYFYVRAAREPFRGEVVRR